MFFCVVSRPRFFFVVFSVGGLGISMHAASAAPTPVYTQAKSPTTFSQAEMLAYLNKKVSSPLSLPVLSPDMKPLRWFEAQSTSNSFQRVGQALLLSQSLMHDSEPAHRKDGFLLASETANFVSARMPDEKWLLARLYQSILLPNISLAHVETWRNPSRLRVLEGAVAAFDRAGETETEKRTLEWLVQTLSPKAFTNTFSDANSLDWARGNLAVLLIASPQAPRADLERALGLLRAITSPNMKGFARVREQLEARLNASPPASAQPLTSARS